MLVGFQLQSNERYSSYTASAPLNLVKITTLRAAPYGDSLEVVVSSRGECGEWSYAADAPPYLHIIILCTANAHIKRNSKNFNIDKTRKDKEQN